MSGEIEAAGAAITAGLAASAIEGRETRGQGHGDGACLNCGAGLTGPYCSQCGQAAHVHRTLSHLFEEVLHGILHFDAKAWRTLPMLAFRPGTLTRNYTYGKRARYLSPLALFLFTIFLMFFVFAFVGVNVVNVNSTEGGEYAAASGDVRQGLAEVRIGESGRDRVEALDAGQADAAAEAESRASAGAGDAAHADTWQQQLSEAARNGEINVNTGWPALDRRILHTIENPDLAIYKVQNAAYKFSFLLVPISLPFVWLLFIWRRGLTLYDHAVFVLYSLSFASLAFVLTALLGLTQWLSWLGALFIPFGMPVHMFFHLKGAYALGWFSALWRTVFLLIFALWSLSFFAIAIVALGLGG